MQESLQKLQKLLQQLFRADAADLDFGIYHIINYRRNQLQTFIDEELLTIVNKALEANAGIESERKEFESLREQIPDGMLDADDNPINEAFAQVPIVKKFLEAKEKRGEPQTRDQREGVVYNHLYTFFSRYYEDGDFIPRRRYSQTERYAVPYNGEEVYLHWANRDQYYVKSGVHLPAYSFKFQGITVTFDLRDVDIEKDNVKGPKRFFIPISDETTYSPETDEICIPFEYRPLTEEEKKEYSGQKQQDKIIDAAEPEIITQLGAYPDIQRELGRKVDDVTLLKKRLQVYTHRNTADFFIHKDLKQFLSRELDIFIKNEVLPLSSLIFEDMNFQEDNLSKVGWIETAKLVYRIASKIIDFLSHIEEFQKRLWLKKKFVLSTDYCITLDRVPEEFYPEIVKNTAQLQEWKDLFAIDEIDKKTNGTKYTEPLSVEFLKENSNLVLDTCHFNSHFVDRLLACFDDLDNETDGLLIHGENFQGLSLLTEKYRQSIKCIHIDPPYNAKSGGFLYKNTYQHSSWLSMMADRLTLAEQLMEEDSCILCHIDENEYEKLFLFFKTLSMDDQGTIVWDKRNPVFGTNTIATQHEYIICYSSGTIKLKVRPINRKAILKQAASLIKKHNGVTDECCKEFQTWIKNKPELTGGERAYSKIDEKGHVYSEVSLSAPGLQTDPKFHEPLIHPETGKQCPVPASGWSRTPEKLQKFREEGRIIFGPNEKKQPRLKIYLKDYLFGELSSVIPTGKRGKGDMVALGLKFDYCHPVDLYEHLVWAGTPDGDGVIIDFFAGSGTNAHAVINLNRRDSGKRKYILVEMEYHFDTVLKPRIKKVVYAEKWKKSKPVSRESRLSHIIKYQRIESYEDALNNIKFKETEHKNLLFDEHPLSYMLDSDTKESPTLLNIAELQNPFSYQLKIVEDMQIQTQTIDLPETFNYLLGLSVRTRQCLQDGDRRYLVYKGTVGEKPVVIIWRETAEWEQEDYERDYKFIYEHKLIEGAAEVYVNKDSNIPEAKSLDPLFKQLMFSQ